MGLSLNQLTTTSGKIKQKEEFDKKHLKIIQIFVWSNHGARSGPAFSETDGSSSVAVHNWH